MPPPVSSLLTHHRLRRLLVLAAAGGGGAVLVSRLARVMRSQRRAQAALAAAADFAPAKTSAKEKPAKDARVAVDARFLQRLRSILKICVPGPASREAALILLQGSLLLARTVLSDYIARLEGTCAEKVTGQDWPAFRLVVRQFALVAVPASVVNSALKAVQIVIQLAFRKRLTVYLHKLYLEQRAYYSASVLGGLGHADQRLTDDVEKFCESVAELYSRTFKPLLDIILFSRSLGAIIGYKGQTFLYGYFIVMGAFLRATSPPLGLMTAQYSSLNGAFRSAHARIVASAEAIAFNDPPAGRAEMQALNRRLERMVQHSRLTAFQRFVQSCVDGYVTKYTASVIGLIIFALPLHAATANTSKMDSSIVAGMYVHSMRAMMQSSSAMGQLVLVYKRINTLAGHTARVSELLEQVRELGRPNGRLVAFQRAQDRVQGTNGGVAQGADAAVTAVANGATTPATNGVAVQRASGSFADICDITSAKVAKNVSGPNIKLEDVSLWAPDGRLLVRDLNMEVPPGCSVLVEGMNGSGKTGLLRMLAGLWPLQSGTVTLPPRDSIFFLPQKPYMFAGGSLASQLMYPNLPGVVIGENASFDEEHGLHCLTAVELPHLLTRCDGWDGVLAWDDILSGGERNRLAVARLLYHRPTFAILDECTAAVSSDGELVLYKAMADAGISMLSVAHRKAVREYHQYSIVFDGNTGWEWKNLNDGSDD